MKYIVLFLSLAFCIGACKKEYIQSSEAEKTVVELEKIIQEKNVKRVYAINSPGASLGSPVNAYAGVTWRFSNGFVTIDDSNQGYNLAFLTSYSVQNVTLNNDTNATGLLLYFTQ